MGQINDQIQPVLDELLRLEDPKIVESAQQAMTAISDIKGSAEPIE